MPSGEHTYIDEVSSRLRIIEKYFPDNLEQAARELGYESVDEIENELGELTFELTKRLCCGDEKYFPDADDEEIKRKIFIPLMNIHQKNPNKLITNDAHKEGVVEINALFSVLYKDLESPEEIEKVVVNYGFKSLKFKGIDWNPCISYELFIAFHPKDFFDIFGYDQNEIRTDYRIDVDPSKKAVTIQIFKPGLKPKPSEVLPQVGEMLQVKMPEEKPQRIEAKIKPSLEEMCDEIEKTLGRFYSSDEIVLKLQQLAAEIMGKYGDVDTAMEIGETCKKIRDEVSPQDSLKKPDKIYYEEKIITHLNKVRSKMKWYTKHARTEGRNY